MQMKKNGFLFTLILILMSPSWVRGFNAQVGKDLFFQAYTEGREVFYRYLAERAAAASLENVDLGRLSRAETEIPKLYEHLMSYYFWLNDWDQQQKRYFLSTFRGISGRMALEFIQSIPNKRPVAGISPLTTVLLSAGYHARKIYPQFRRFIRPMRSRASRQWALQFLEIGRVHKKTKGKNIRIAIIDTGIDPSLRETRVRIKKSKNFLNGSNPIGEKGRIPVDWHGHGTAVASVVYQIAPAAELMIAKFYDRDSMQNVPPSRWTGYLMAAGIRWAVENGADVINISAAFRFDLKDLRKAAQYCWEKNVILVASVGNFSSEMFKNTPCYPAAYDYSIAVGGVERCDQGLTVWKRSANGKYIDLVAPAGDLWVQSPQYRGRRRLSNLASGNSMAAAIVSATAALMLASMDQNDRRGLKNMPGRLCEFVRNILRQTSSNSALGFSSPNAASGYGIINVYRAVEAVILPPDF